ncbi:type II secretion system protein GspC [Vibrio sp. HDW18]|uniref:type II secretion system protein GspC n=1 Tax=Vibrio sp. HDW18 TaxID=2714948 RepID=UPI00140BBB0A|nr:type II secretion system protein GspC [Vibrio sp. HDW18]QIL85596.1 type II secretion system protein GspC [Vibrio sp. HDW18]
MEFKQLPPFASWPRLVGERALRWQKPISQGLTLFLLVVAAWMVGKIVWLVLADPVPVPSWQPTPLELKSEQQSIDISGLQSGALFGIFAPTKPPVVVAPVVVDAPKTRLTLVLSGVVASNDPQKSLAVIANRGVQATYGLNEVIEGTQVKLKAVLADRVIISNAGRDETLMLEGLDYTASTAAPAPNNSAPATQPKAEPTSQETLDTIREAIARNPQELFQYVRLSQVKRDEKVIGYRVSPGKDAALFESVGLQAGDVAVALNGMDLSDPNIMNSVFQSINELTEISLTVERDGQQYDVYIQF